MVKIKLLNVYIKEEIINGEAYKSLIYKQHKETHTTDEISVNCTFYE